MVRVKIDMESCMNQVRWAEETKIPTVTAPIEDLVREAMNDLEEGDKACWFKAWRFADDQATMARSLKEDLQAMMDRLKKM